MTNRALVIVGPDGDRALVSHLADSPGDLPGVNLIFDGLALGPGAASSAGHALGAEGEDRLEVAAHERAAGQLAERARSRSRSAPCRS